MWENIDIPGNDLPGDNWTGSAADCYKRCLEYPSCNYYSWEKDSHRCWMKHGVDDPNFVTGGHNFRMKGIDIPGSDLQDSVAVPNENTCAVLCDSTPGCLWYNYNINNKACWLKKGEKKQGSVTQFKATAS